MRTDVLVLGEPSFLKDALTQTDEQLYQALRAFCVDTFTSHPAIVVLEWRTPGPAWEANPDKAKGKPEASNPAIQAELPVYTAAQKALMRACEALRERHPLQPKADLRIHETSWRVEMEKPEKPIVWCIARRRPYTTEHREHLRRLRLKMLSRSTGELLVLDGLGKLMERREPTTDERNELQPLLAKS